MQKPLSAATEQPVAVPQRQVEDARDFVLMAVDPFLDELRYCRTGVAGGRIGVGPTGQVLLIGCRASVTLHP